MTYIVDGTVGNTNVASGGLLKGNGTVGNTTIQSGGQVAPGDSPGCLTVSGNLTLNGTDTVDIQSPGSTACTDYDQMIVTGNVDLTSGTLSTVFLGGFTPKIGQSYEIINNQGSNAVTGTFNGLPEGTVFAVGSTHLKITYKGGTGNDVVLTVVNLPTTPNTGFGSSHTSSLAPIIGLTVIAGGIYLVARRFKKSIPQS